LISKKGKVYIPKNKAFRVEIIQLHYDVPVVGHRRRWETTELVIKNYWWPRVMKDVGKYVDGCKLYHRMKNRTEVPVGKLKLSKVPEKLWTHLTVDFITKLLLVVCKNVIQVVYNRLSKMKHFVATIEGTLAERLARLFRYNIWKLHELPESVVLDRGPQFAAELTKKLNKILGIETKLLTLFHPQTDEQTE